MILMNKILKLITIIGFEIEKDVDNYSTVYRYKQYKFDIFQNSEGYSHYKIFFYSHNNIYDGNIFLEYFNFEEYLKKCINDLKKTFPIELRKAVTNILLNITDYE